MLGRSRGTRRRAPPAAAAGPAARCAPSASGTPSSVARAARETADRSRAGCGSRSRRDRARGRARTSRAISSASGVVVVAAASSISARPSGLRTATRKMRTRSGSRPVVSRSNCRRRSCVEAADRGSTCARSRPGTAPRAAAPGPLCAELAQVADGRAGAAAARRAAAPVTSARPSSARTRKRSAPPRRAPDRSRTPARALAFRPQAWPRGAADRRATPARATAETRVLAQQHARLGIRARPWRARGSAHTETMPGVGSQPHSHSSSIAVTSRGNLAPPPAAASGLLAVDLATKHSPS